MGVGFQVSALHKIGYLEPVEGAAATEPPPFWLSALRNAHWDGRPTHIVFPAQAEIVTWRDRIAAKYRGQLGEPLTWDETSIFSASEDAATSWDFNLHYVAAVLDLHGHRSAAALLKGRKKPGPAESTPIFDAIEARGFTSKFPQLLLGANYWLPFRRNLIIEEPNWRGDLDRFGSTARLMDEIGHISRFIKATDPLAPTTPEVEDQDALVAAWKSAAIIHRLGSLAVREHLPFWTTG